jgi:hypothetical protein
MMGFPTASRPWGTIFVAIMALLAMVPAPTYATLEDTYYTKGTDAKGVTRKLANDRYPDLYTGEFGDCMGGHSLINVTGFDAAYYADNMTVLFHLTGSTNINNESVMGMVSILS